MVIYKKSIFNTDCDECGRPFSIEGGGVCERCRRILCGKHLHGSIPRRLAIAFGATPICVRCRSGEAPDTMSDASSGSA